MTILGFILSNPVLIAIMGGLLAALVAFLKGNSRGARLERDRQARAEQKARDVADQVDNDIGALPPNRAREELKRW
ncbi:MULTISPECIES: hypothetical protein [Hyphomicrobiales]|uniref:hypothetical protein n=1 Tax=Hyphomicrobiales TaxID=356 RepID=UPI000362987B|nr:MULTISPECIES: hypothetical protein [Phyllobacteriaceae]MCX8572869.1 hypothetical protein [Aminobacter sp. MET-1]